MNKKIKITRKQWDILNNAMGAALTMADMKDNLEMHPDWKKEIELARELLIYEMHIDELPR